MKELDISTAEAKVKATGRLQKACQSRWLSFDASVKAVDTEYPALLQTLYALKPTDATALGLYTKVKDATLIGTVYGLSEILPHLSTLSKTFQRGTVDFATVIYF